MATLDLVPSLQLSDSPRIAPDFRPSPFDNDVTAVPGARVLVAGSTQEIGRTDVGSAVLLDVETSIQK